MLIRIKGEDQLNIKYQLQRKSSVQSKRHAIFTRNHTLTQTQAFSSHCDFMCHERPLLFLCSASKDTEKTININSCHHFNSYIYLHKHPEYLYYMHFQKIERDFCINATFLNESVPVNILLTPKSSDVFSF